LNIASKRPHTQEGEGTSVGAGLTLAGKLPEKHDLDGKPETNYVHRDMNVEEGLHCKLANILPMFDFLSNFYQSNLN